MIVLIVCPVEFSAILPLVADAKVHPSSAAVSAVVRRHAPVHYSKDVALKMLFCPFPGDTTTLAKAELPELSPIGQIVNTEWTRGQIIWEL